MRSDFKEDELALYIGGRILADADKLRLFMPDCFARFPIEWDGYNYEIHIYPRGRANDVQQ
jgi:hypothetical protein